MGYGGKNGSAYDVYGNDGTYSRSAGYNE